MIYVITHKIFDDDIIDDDNYKILHVGTNNNCKNSYLRDDIGKNISDKNSNYCELTGLYWIWKNCGYTPNDILGLVHYRRYFIENIIDKKSVKSILSYKRSKELLKKYDIILPEKVKSIYTIKEAYYACHVSEDLDITRQAIADIYPEYLLTFDRVMDMKSYYYANMMICNGNYFSQYCQWLFDILTYVESKIDINKYEDDYQKRVFGFLSERLINIWVIHNNLRIKELPVHNTELKQRGCVLELVSNLKEMAAYFFKKITKKI